MKKTTQATFGMMGLALFSGVSTASAKVESLIGGDIIGEISTGWDSKYFFRGLWFGDENAWTNLEFSKEICSNLTGSVNLFYTEVLDDQAVGDQFSFSEANVGANLSYDAGFGTFNLGFLHYRFFDGFGGSNSGGRLPGVAGNGDATELSLTYSQEILWGVSASVMYAHDFRIDGSYAEVGFGKIWSLSEDVGFKLSVSTGYSLDDYYSASRGAKDSDFTHTLVSLALPIQLTETGVLTPHVSANFSHGAREATNNANGQNDNEVYFGASFGVLF